LAAGIETQDNTVFTVTLREGVTFHDGSPLTAADVVYSFSRARRSGGMYAARLSPVSSVAVLNDLAVLVTAPVFNAAALLDFPIIRESGLPIPPGTGPYYARFTEEGGFLLPFEGWWQGKPHPVPRIELEMTADTETLVWSFQYGYISMMPFDPLDTFAPGIHAGYDKITVPSALMQYIGFNTGRRPFDRLAARQAAAMAIDRRGAAARVYGEDAQAAFLPVPPSSPFHHQSAVMEYRFDPGEAARLLSGSSSVPALDFIIGAENAPRLQMAEYIAENLRLAGFDVILRPLGQAAFTAALEAGDFDLYYAEARLAPNLDPSEFLSSGGAFAFGVSESAAMSGALSRLAAVDPYSPEGHDALADVWQTLASELPILTVCFRHTLFISQRGLLSGQTPTFYNPFSNFADWTVHER
jgi:peptide/nickel transport system substrate-binding protein